MIRKLVIVLTSLWLAACAAPEFKPLEFKPPVALQDPLPGQAIVYLLRVPHDGAAVPVYFNGTKVASMPPESYTAVSLRPGTYALSSVASDGSAQSEASVLTVGAGERRFLYAGVPTRGSTSLFFVPFKPTGVIPLAVPLRQATGGRFWHECNEQDAQGLLSISKVTSPERDAL